MKSLFDPVATACALAMVLSIPALARANPSPPAASVPAAQISASSQSPAAGPAARLAPPDSLRKSKALLGAMHDRLKRVQVVHDAARKQRAAIPESCVSARITEIKAIIQIADESMAALDEALRQRDDEERLYQLTRLNLLAEKAQKAEQASRSCINHELSIVQTTGSKVETETGIPQQDPTELPLLRR